LRLESRCRGPGPRDVIAFELDAEAAGRTAGVSHFGFRLVDAADIDAALDAATSAGGRLLRRGEFAPGLPLAYLADPTDTRSRSGMSERARQSV